MLIKIYEIKSQRPNGDRDIITRPCSKFEVWLINGEKRELVSTFDQWDQYWTSIKGTRLGYLRLANERARSLSELLDGIEIESIETTAKEVEIMHLEDVIADAQDKLQRLKS